MLNKNEKILVDYLRKNAFGKKNAVRRQQIIRDLGISDRNLRYLKINIVRKHGVPIGSTGKGYSYALDDLEILNFQNEYKSRFEECLLMMKAYKEMRARKGQRSMI